MTTQQGQQGEARALERRLDEASIAAYKATIGTRLRIHNIWNKVASEDTFLHFVDGLGDANPLYRDEAYARSSRYGVLPAHPAWFYSVFPTWVQHGLPGIHAIPGGNAWEWFAPVLTGDRITPECYVKDIVEKEGRFAGRMLIEYQECRFYNQVGALVATSITSTVRAERGSAKQRGKLSGRTLPHPWTEEEVAKIEERILAEKPSAGKVRFWEDVQVGEALPTIVRGPIGETDMLAFIMGAQPEQCPAQPAAIRLFRQHPGWSYWDPRSRKREHIGMGVHLNAAIARQAGVPYAYDMAPWRQSLQMYHLTSWMSDEGWLKSNTCQYRVFVFHSDVLTFNAKVTKKYVDKAGEHCVDIETAVTNQFGDLVMPGTSTVVLPSRDKGQYPLARRLPRGY